MSEVLFQIPNNARLNAVTSDEATMNTLLFLSSIQLSTLNVVNNTLTIMTEKLSILIFVIVRLFILRNYFISSVGGTCHSAMPEYVTACLPRL